MRPANRLRGHILCSLAYRPQTINQLAARFEKGRTTIVHHLAVLEDKGLVVEIRDTYPILYRRKNRA